MTVEGTPSMARAPFLTRGDSPQMLGTGYPNPPLLARHRDSFILILAVTRFWRQSTPSVPCATRGGSCSDGYFLFLSCSQYHHLVSRRDVLILSHWLTLRWASRGTLTITRKKRSDLACWVSGHWLVSFSAVDGNGQACCRDHASVGPELEASRDSKRAEQAVDCRTHPAFRGYPCRKDCRARIADRVFQCARVFSSGRTHSFPAHTKELIHRLHRLGCEAKYDHERLAA